jgi:hypothetical protein
VLTNDPLADALRATPDYWDARLTGALDDEAVTYAAAAAQARYREWVRTEAMNNATP